METKTNMSVEFPHWWISTRKQRKLLFQHRIFNTCDLIKAAAHSLNPTLSDTDNDFVSVRVKCLYEFCNVHLGGLKLHVRKASTEPGIVVCGRKEKAMITFQTPNTLEEDNVYGWTTQDVLDAYPPECYCPITTDVFEDAVVLEDGFSYERKQIETWLLRNNTSPMTGETLSTKAIVANRAIMQLIHRLA